MPDIFDTRKRSEIMKSVRNKNTLLEITIQSLLDEMQYNYELEYKFTCCKPDIAIPGVKKALFVHGCFWHGHDCKRGHLPSINRNFWEEKIEKNVARDARNYSELRSAGWEYLVVWGCEIKKKNFGILKDKISGFLK
jgi:DNA mismatch endonuclease Vsr